MFLTQDLTSEEYDNYLTQSNCIILPYRRQAYYTRLSGIAIEAAMLGIPLIYTRDTWLEDAVTQYGAGIGIQNEDPMALANSIALMTENIEHYRTIAQKRAALAQTYHSPEHFLRCLWSV